MHTWFNVKSGKIKEGNVSTPVLYTENGQVDVQFESDSYHQLDAIVPNEQQIVVEAYCISIRRKDSI